MTLFSIIKGALAVVAASIVGVTLTGCGSSSAGSTPTAPTTPPVTPPTAPTTPAVIPRFLYTTNENSANISGYSVNASTGALTPLAGFPIPSGVNPATIIHDPSNKFAIVADIAADLIHVYSIDATSGMLSEISPSPYSTGHEPRGLAIDPTGSFLYVASQQLYSVDAFAVSSSGVLTRIAGAPFATGGSGNGSFACCVAIGPSGKFLYASDLSSVYALSINATTGALTPVNALPGPSSLGGIAVDPAGTFLYAVGSGTNAIDSFSINSTTGTLTLAGTSPLQLQNGAYTIAIDPNGQFAYTVESSDTLVAYSLAKGSFTSLGSYSGALGSLQLAIDPSASFIYAPQTGTTNNLSGFKIGTSGTLTSLPGSPTPTGIWPLSLTITSVSQ